MIRKPFLSLAGIWVGLLLAPGCASADPEQRLQVTASAYNSVRAQTNDDPTLTAWGDRLRPGMKAIAVSRDLLDLGLTHGVRVRIEGLRGEYRDRRQVRVSTESWPPLREPVAEAAPGSA